MKNKIKYVLCPGSQPSPQYSNVYNSVFDCWQTVWKQSYQEWGVEKPLYSDSFSRQDFIGSILLDDRCVALSFFRWTNAGLHDFRTDSYFSNWTDTHLEVLRSRGNNIIVCSNFTIHPLARGANLGFSMKDLLVAISIETFMNSAADGMTGNLNISRKVNEACAKWGGHLIEANVPAGHGLKDQNGDLMGFFKDVISERAPMELDSWVTQLWNNRTEIDRQHPSFAPAFKKQRAS